MIHGIMANKPTFHPVTFTVGLNVVVAETRDSKDKKETRNGLGKSTLIEIIDFCLGSSLQRGQGLSLEILNDWAFTLDLTVAEKRVKATRSLASPTRIVVEGDTHGWIRRPEVDEKTGEAAFHIDDWKKVLGWALFQLETVETTDKYKPSYRALISYFLRSGIGAYLDPFSHFKNQKAGNIQLSIAYLIGLNWQHAAKWQVLKDKEDAIKAVEKAVDSGLTETVGALEAEKITLESSLENERKELANFKVHNQYAEIQSKVNEFTQQIHRISNENILDKRKLQFYKDASSEEGAPEIQQLEEIYKQSGLLFPDRVKKSLSDARNFHNQVIKNRKEFLELEILRLKREISSREQGIKDLTNERADALNILSTHGAFEEYALLQEKNISTKQKIETLKAKIAELRSTSSQKKAVKADRIELTKVAEIDYDERRPSWEKAVRIFNENSQALYREPGRFVINISETGYKFKVDIERSQSEGIGKMKLFCFDLMLAKLWKQENQGIDFLVHDSIMYDGVDARQRALALELAAKVSAQDGFQYICTLNSDMVPVSDFSDDFNFNDYVRLRLTDGDPSGSLLGIRY